MKMHLNEKHAANLIDSMNGRNRAAYQGTYYKIHVLITPVGMDCRIDYDIASGIDSLWGTSVHYPHCIFKGSIIDVSLDYVFLPNSLDLDNWREDVVNIAKGLMARFLKKELKRSRMNYQYMCAMYEACAADNIIDKYSD